MMHDDDRDILKAFSSGIAKSILYICLTVFGCIWLSNCTLEEATIISCQESCDGSGAYMESVTNRECICADKNKSNDVWVRPSL
jgi:hypothetical protein